MSLVQNPDSHNAVVRSWAAYIRVGGKTPVGAGELGRRAAPVGALNERRNDCGRMPDCAKHLRACGQVDCAAGERLAQTFC